LAEKDLNFQCDMCGLCCQRVGLSDVYKHLDRGDHACRYYEDSTHRCSIYDERPIICNVEAFYEKYMKSKMSKEMFFKLNYSVCEKLKGEYQSSKENHL